MSEDEKERRRSLFKLLVTCRHLGMPVAVLKASLSEDEAELVDFWQRELFESN